jgi:hypothetical protein
MHVQTRWVTCVSQSVTRGCRAESRGDCWVLWPVPIPGDSGIIPVLLLPFSPFLSPIHHLDMPGDILKKRKIAVLGSRSVGEPAKFIIYDYMLIPPSATSGKSSLVIQFTENQFIESYYPTIENTFTKSVSYKGVDYDCDIIDTAGQVCTRVLHVTLFPLTTRHWKGRVLYPQFKACHWNPWFCSRLLGHLEKFFRHDPDPV